jgi:ATP-binding cassette subfamily B multidrug efflux pump
MFKFFEGLIDPYQPYPQNDVPATRLRPFLAEYVRPFRRIFVVTGVISALNAVLEVALIWYMGRIVDVLAQSQPAQIWAEYGREIVLVGMAVLIVKPLVGAVGVALLHNTILPNFTSMMRWRAHAHVLRQPVGWFESDFAGRIANRIMQTPPAAGDVVFDTFDAVAFASTSLIGAGIMLAGADPVLIAPLVIWFAGYVMLMRWTVRRAGPAAEKASEARSNVTGRVVDSYANIHSVKLFANGDQELAYGGAAIEEARQAFMAEMRIVTKMDTTLSFLNGFLVTSITGWAIYLWYAEAASLGTVALATTIALRLTNMTYWIMWVTTNLVKNLGTISEGMQTIAQAVTLVDSPDAQDLQFSRGEIFINGVSHHYGRGTGGLQSVSLTIRPNEKIGIVGRSGSGKSTLVKLILRFYDAESGQILIDGQDIACVRQDSLRAKIGMVSQDSSLMHRSVRENILYGRPNAGEAAMIDAAQKADAMGFIEGLRDPQGRTGFDAHVGERGVKLSGGQRQRVALARVILKDAPILILDEATSALDSEAEATIQDALFGVMQGKTVIAIAHRLSTIAQMDRIIVLDDGKIAEQGTHRELLAKNGLYAGFWARQSGGFLGADE